MKSKKAMELPINIVVMLIIGIIIFGLGFALFSKIYADSEDLVGTLNGQIREDIADLECRNDEGWLCSPSVKMRDGDRETFWIYVTNKGDLEGEFEVLINTDTLTDAQGIQAEGCGEVVILQTDQRVNIKSGRSAAIPYIVLSSRVTKSPCSFITSAEITAGPPGSTAQKTPIIIRVE